MQHLSFAFEAMFILNGREQSRSPTVRDRYAIDCALSRGRQVPGRLVDSLVSFYSVHAYVHEDVCDACPMPSYLRTQASTYAHAWE
ncbi:hypothetical protein Trydic_g15672 [Trypoxylus dichotomus]